jgi:hypothetical protein
VFFRFCPVDANKRLAGPLGVNKSSLPELRLVTELGVLSPDGYLCLERYELLVIGIHPAQDLAKFPGLRVGLCGSGRNKHQSQGGRNYSEIPFHTSYYSLKKMLERTLTLCFF